MIEALARLVGSGRIGHRQAAAVYLAASAARRAALASGRICGEPREVDASATDPPPSPLDAAPGEVSTSSCGCRWKRVQDLQIAGVSISGDVIVDRCPYHAWYSRQPPDVQREVSRFFNRSLRPE
jgi:hypothetical protein